MLRHGLNTTARDECQLTPLSACRIAPVKSTETSLRIATQSTRNACSKVSTASAWIWALTLSQLFSLLRREREGRERIDRGGGKERESLDEGEREREREGGGLRQRKWRNRGKGEGW